MGYIEKRGKQSWRLVVDVGLDSNGNRIRRTKTIKVEDPTILRAPRRLKEHLELELAKFKIEVEAGEYITPEKMTFAQFVEEWRVKYAEKELSPKTIKEYMGDLKNRFIPVFGHKQIAEITTLQIVTLFNELKKPQARKDGQDKPLSSRRILFLYKVLKCVFDRAVEWKLLKEHPMQGIKQPKLEPAKRNFYDSEEAVQVLVALMDEPPVWRLYFQGALMGGFRRGELLGLEWPDVDFENNTITIRQQISLTQKGQAVIDTPKTEQSADVVDMPSWYMRDLYEFYEKWQEEKKNAGDSWEGGNHQFVFHNGLGKPYYYTTPTAKWRKFLKDKGFRHVRLHDLRHSTGTLLMEMGEDLKSIQERLRHSRSETTADIYVHVTKTMKKRTASKLEKFDPRLIRHQFATNSENDKHQLIH